MSIIEAYNEAWDNGDVDALAKIIHDDCVFNPHVGGKQSTSESCSKMTKSVWPIPSFTLPTILILKP